jgi:hypothetical protein
MRVKKKLRSDKNSLRAYLKIGFPTIVILRLDRGMTGKKMDF